MIKKIKGYTVKFTAGMVLAATLMSTASMAASASGLQVQAKGSVVATQQVASVTTSDVASVAGNDVVSVSANNVVRVGAGKTDDAVVEDQGNMNSSQYAVDSVVDENADWHEGDGDMNIFHIYYQKARDMVANKNRMDEIRKADEEARKARQEKEAEESRRAEQYKKAEEAKLEEYAKKVHEDRIAKEGQGDVIDDQFAYVEGQGDVIDDQFAVATDDASATVNADAQSKTDDAKKAEDDLELREEDKSEQTKQLEIIYKALFPVKEALHADDETMDKIIDEKLADHKDKKFVESTKKMAKLLVKTVDSKATGTVCPCIGAVRHMVKIRLLASKANDAKTPELKEKYMIEIQETAQDGIITSIPGISDLQTVVDGGKIVAEQYGGEKAKQIVSDLFDIKMDYVPGLGSLAIQSKANLLLRKAENAKTPEEKAKYMKEYKETQAKVVVSYIPGGAAIFDLCKAIPKWFS